MAADFVELQVEERTDFGKGASRRARREGYIPAVLYGHGEKPRHLLLPRHDGFLALRNPNQLLRLTAARSEEHTSELQSRGHLVCRLLLEKKKNRRLSYLCALC